MKFNGINITIGKNVSIGKNVRIGDNTIIYDNVSIGDNTTIANNCSIGEPLNSYYSDDNYCNPPLVIGNNSLIRSYSIIYAGSRMGSNFQLGHYSIIRERNMIGNNCMVGPHCIILDGCSIGNYCRFHSYDEIGENTKVDDFVFFYPKVLVSTDPVPPSDTVLSSCFGEFTQVASNVMVMPGAHIGKHCLISAMTSVSGEIKDFMFVGGNPGKKIGDIREISLIDPKTKEFHYPWPLHFSKNMPWEYDGFIDWAKKNNIDISELDKHV